MAVSCFDWIAHHAEVRGGKTAIVDLHSGKSLTYAAFHDRIARLATVLRGIPGVARGERVAVLAHNAADVFEIQFACGRIGAIFVPLNWRLTEAELTQILSDAEPALLIHDPEFDETAFTLAAVRPGMRLLAHGPEDSAYERLIQAAAPLDAPVALTHGDLATILYTSGTTGLPKGVMITHGMRFWQTINLSGPMRITADSTCLTVLPLFHVGGLDVYANPLFHFGGTVLVMRAYDPARTLSLLSDPGAGVTLFVGTPAHYQFMARLPDFDAARFSTRLLAGVAAAPVPVPQLRFWENRGLPLQQFYGMTEACGGVIALDPTECVRKAGSTGRPVLHVEARVVRADGTAAPPGVLGEVWLRGPSITPGYWRKPEATAAAFQDGWYRSGDAAIRDAEGYYSIVDRWKDMYISGGENVYPAEVEEVLYQLPAIAEVAIIGVADETWGEVGRAIVVVKPDHTLSEADVMRHCEGRIARYKHPRSIRFVEALPRNATGKVHKPTLRTAYGVG